jgi:prepilin-type N-terminal cleavage/methylation domain-containing protein
MKKNDEGFTLIELLIVIVILGILATVVVFAVGGITDRGQKSACETDKATLEVAIEAYFAKKNAYPPNQAILTVGTTKFLRDTSTNYTTTGGTGAITALSTGKCVAP